jgi:twinkle protein
VLDENVYAVSVPNGAPQRVSNKQVDASEDIKFNYIWDAKDVLNDCDKIILVTDNDEAGHALQEELARRIGRAKCYSVMYPDDCKDANDVLKAYGIDAVRGMIDSAEPLPLEGVYQVDDYRQEVQQLYQNGMIGGLSTGMHSIDKLFTVVQGQLSIVTGIPGSGKSEFIDQLMVNLSKKYGWKFAVASFENPPALHIAKLAEKIAGKPFFDGPTSKMSEAEASSTLDYIHEHFMFLEQRTGEAATIDSVLDRCQQAVMRMGVRGLVIDPYNYIAQSQKADNEHQGINDMLTRLVAFARAQGIHIWFIAHPAKMPTDQEGRTAVPKGMNISGSASFFAKADLGITVHRNKNRDVEVHCWKVRFKWLGQVGKTVIEYDIPTGRYSDQVIDVDVDIPAELTRSPHETDKEWY